MAEAELAVGGKPFVGLSGRDGSHNAARGSQEEVSDGKLLTRAVMGVILQWWNPGGKPGPLTAFQETAHSPCVLEVTWRAHCRNTDLSQLEAKGGLVVPLSSGWGRVGLTLRLDSAPKRSPSLCRQSSVLIRPLPVKQEWLRDKIRGPAGIEAAPSIGLSRGAGGPKVGVEERGWERHSGDSAETGEGRWLGAGMLAPHVILLSTCHGLSCVACGPEYVCVDQRGSVGQRWGCHH